MKFLTTLILLPLIITSVKAEIIDEIQSSYNRVSATNKLDLESTVKKVHSSKNLSQLSMDDWITYAKASRQKKSEKSFSQDFEFIKFKSIDSFTQLLTFYQNEPESFNEELKTLLVKSWWQVALLDDEECESLRQAYKVGKDSLIEGDNKGIDLLKKIVSFTSK